MASSLLQISLLACCFWILSEAYICNPSAVYKRDCNICRCSEDGQELTCTEKLCPPVEDEKSPEYYDSYESTLFRRKITKLLEEIEKRSGYDNSDSKDSYDSNGETGSWENDVESEEVAPDMKNYYNIPSVLKVHK